MDIFSLNKQTYENGKLINGIDTVTWIERYATNGEVTITGEPTQEFLSDLAQGVLISHIETEDIMMIETHEIDETVEGPPKLKVQARSIDQIAMENRVVTLSTETEDTFDDGLSTELMEYDLALGNTWHHIELLLERYLTSDEFNVQEKIPNLQIRSEIFDTESVQKRRISQKFGLLSTVVQELLSSIDAGLRVERRNAAHPEWIEFVVHDGVDKSNTVRFDWSSGDLESAHYLWSNKSEKNSAYTFTEHYTLQVLSPGKTGLDLRIMPVDATDWKFFDETLSPEQITAIKQILSSRTVDALKKNKSATLMDAVISKNSRFRYNVDYSIGDIVYVLGNYGVSSKMRVVEYCKTVDENGESGFPTLAPIE